MAGSIGLSLCHTSRGRFTVVTITLAILVALTLLYSFVCCSSSSVSLPLLLSEQQGLKNSRIREDRLSLVVTNCLTNFSLRGTRKFPSALIIGARKGGTRALIDMLKCHPEVVTAVSEVHYFDRDENFSNGVQWYIDKMPLSTISQITIEKSPSYFVSHLAAQRIYNMSPNIKIILIIRNPLDRTVSDYTQLLRKGRNRGSFEGEVFLSPSGEVNSAFYPVSISMYDVHFERWLKYFKLNQILVLDGDGLIKNPVMELKRVEDFLGVGKFFSDEMFYFNATKGFYCWKKIDEGGHRVPFCLGSAKGHPLPQLSNDTVNRLVSFFRPHNKHFFAQIQQSLNWDRPYRNIAAHSKF